MATKQSYFIALGNSLCACIQAEAEVYAHRAGAIGETGPINMKLETAMRVHHFHTLELLFAIAVVMSTLSTSAQTTASEKVLFTGTSTSQLIQASDGNYYGTSSLGGTGNAGFIFSMTSTGAMTAIYNFTAGADGGTPLQGAGYSEGNLIEGNDGNLYGTNTTGGQFGNGVLFRVTLGGTLTVLHSFAQSDGTIPGTLIEDNAGNLFGAAASGNALSRGTVFEYSASNVFTVLHTFTATPGDCSAPNAELLEASDGLIYGVTQLGGPSGTAGCLFRFDPANPTASFTTFASFPLTGLGDPRYLPQYGLTEGADGALYGITEYGGTSGGGEGTIYKVTLGSAPSLTLPLYSFVASTDGAHPVSGLTLGGDENFYGATSEFGPNQRGTVFQYVPAGSGAFSIIHPFAFSGQGGLASSGPVEGADGDLYGVAGSVGYQMVLTPPIAPPIKFTASLGPIAIGQSATLNWQVMNAYSKTASNCYAHGAWSGSQPLTGSQVVTPSTTGTFVYALTCGGVESSVVTVTVVPLEAPTATPVITPSGGAFGGPVAYNITDATPGARIYYTTDGTAPTASSSVWSGPPIVIDQSVTIQAAAVANAMPVSGIANASFVINNTSVGTCSIPYGRGFTNIDLELNHGAAISVIIAKFGQTRPEEVLRMTSGLQNQNTSAYYKQRIPHQAFVSEFRFRFDGANASAAGGLAFVLQADNMHALGSAGISLGYAKIPYSLALAFNMSTPFLHEAGASSVALGVDGSIGSAIPVDRAPSGIDFHSGHEMDAVVTYDGLYLMLDLKDTVTDAHFKNVFQVPSANPFGITSTVYAGFTAATGVNTSTTIVDSWSLESAGVCQ